MHSCTPCFLFCEGHSISLHRHWVPTGLNEALLSKHGQGRQVRQVQAADNAKVSPMDQGMPAHQESTQALT